MDDALLDEIARDDQHHEFERRPLRQLTRSKKPDQARGHREHRGGAQHDIHQERTAIAITLNETPMQWGENRVNVIALAAFSAHDRSAFQTVFEQFVEVFGDHADVQRLLRGSDDFPSFIDELVRLIDS